MVVTNKLYKLVLKNSDNVSAIWKVLHTTTFIALTILGYASSYSFGKSLSELNFKCYLYGNVSVTNGSEPGFNKSSQYIIPISNDMFINNEETIWNYSLMCNFCQTIPLVSSITAVIFAVFYVIAPNGGEIMDKPVFASVWRMAYPTVVCCLVMISLLFSTQYFLARGFDVFRKPFNESTYEEDINLYTAYFKGTKRPLVFEHQLSHQFAFISFWVWILQLVLLIARIFTTVDYDIYKLKTDDDTTDSSETALVP